MDCGFRIEDTGFWIPRQWNLDPDSNRWQDYGFLELNSGLYQQKFSGFQISQEKLPQIPDPKSGLTYMRQTVNTARDVLTPLL